MLPDSLNALTPAVSYGKGKGTRNGEEINGSDPNTAESTLGVDGISESDVSIQWTESGFSVLCESCMGHQWTLYDMTGRSALSGRIEAHNPVAIPAGSYVLSVPELDLHEVCPQLR